MNMTQQVTFDSFKGHSLIVSLKDGEKKEAIDPRRCKPYFFWFVDEDSSNFGIGTFESPFQTLKEAEKRV